MAGGIDAWVIDSGNTRIKVGKFEGGKLVFQDGLTDWEHFLEKESKKLPVLICDVSGNDFSAAKKKANVVFLDNRLALPFESEYKTPDTLGADRKALVAAAQYFFPNQSSLIVDAGTCVTYDWLAEGRVYKGGAISPGLKMRLTAMHTFTGKLPEVQVSATAVWPGTSTKECMEAGSLLGLAAEINGFYERSKAVESQLNLILTGGDGPLLAKQLKCPLFVNSEFIMYGLYQILKYHVEKEY